MEPTDRRSAEQNVRNEMHLTTYARTSALDDFQSNDVPDMLMNTPIPHNDMGPWKDRQADG